MKLVKGDVKITQTKDQINDSTAASVEENKQSDTSLTKSPPKVPLLNMEKVTGSPAK
jgi:hypothetical protein